MSNRWGVPPRYAIPDVIEIVKGPGSLSRELNRLRERYPEVFEKELDRIRKRNEDRDPNWILVFTVRFRKRNEDMDTNCIPVLTVRFRASSMRPSLRRALWRARKSRRQHLGEHGKCHGKWDGNCDGFGGVPVSGLPRAAA